MATPRIQRSCNCIEAAMEPDALPPGGKAEIVLNVVLARLKRASGEGVIKVRWADSSATQLSFDVSRKRVPTLALSPSNVSLRAIESRARPLVTFVADYFPDHPPALDEFAVRRGDGCTVRLEDVRLIGAHAVTGSILLESMSVSRGVNRLQGTGLPPAELQVK